MDDEQWGHILSLACFQKPFEEIHFFPFFRRNKEPIAKFLLYRQRVKKKGIINKIMASDQVHELVQDYYGKQLQTTNDLKTTACCDTSSTPKWLRPLLSKIHPEVLSKYYGCGLVCPQTLEGCKILDLGSGSGRDVYALAQLVGPSGQVIGVDMTDEQLAVAEKHHAFHVESFGYDNVRFVKGHIESLGELDLEPNSFDVIVSNCVVNLSPDKDAVIAGVHRLLKPGGEFYFSDVYSDRRVPEPLRNDAILYGECLGGALYWNDFLRIAQRQGFADVRLVEDSPISVTDTALAGRVGNIRFFSGTFRLFKLDLETTCEDYGQAVLYKGTIPESPNCFILDKDHKMEQGKIVSVSGNTFKMLQNTRFAAHFEFFGTFDQHFGAFPRPGARRLPFSTKSSGSAKGGCC